MATASSSSDLRSTPTSDSEERSSIVTPNTSHAMMNGKGDDAAKMAFLNESVKEPGEHDVLCGRGGSINSHPGNERFRHLVEKRKRVYLTARFKREKRLIASSIVQEIRDLRPPGRFLSRDAKSGLWKDIGDEKARDKTSQALRENAPSIRAEIETEINEQRAEMMREEEEIARVTSSSTPLPPPPFYNPGWGYPHSYYGYSHHAPPPPPPHHPHHAPPPPPHGYHSYESPWPPPPHHHHASSYHAPPPPYPPYHAPPPHHTHDPERPKSTLQQTADFVSSGAESIKNWTKASLSFGGVQSVSSRDGRDAGSAASVKSKPIVYVHEDESKKRRIVKFRDDDRYRRKRTSRPCYSPLQSNNSLGGTNSLVDVMDDELEPQNLEAADEEPNSSLMKQVANHILGSIGSWDGATIACGYDNSDDRSTAFFPSSLSLGGGGGGGSSSSRPRAPVEPHREEMAVEWEGQEVQLVDKKNEYDSVSSDERMPPPEVRQQQRLPVPDMASSLGLSSLGSCHSWLPEQFGSAASYFSYSQRASSPINSMDMGDYSAGADYSNAGSLGGNSLTRVFEHDVMDPHQQQYATSMHQYAQHQQPSPSSNHLHMSQRALNQVPSWERSLRSKSPLSIGDDDDESLVSKASSKLSASILSPASSTHSVSDDHSMLCE